MSEPSRPAALAGVTVLDFTQHLAGPSATQILADLGANVLKIESPDGDFTRTIAPYMHAGDSIYFHSTSRNKQSIVLNLKVPAAREVVVDLAARADVVVENFRPGVAAKIGIDYETLRRVNPRLVGCSVSGFGQTGPQAERPAFDMVVQALAGVMSLTGEAGGRPVRCGIPVGDVIAGLFATIGILAALEARRHTGEGQYVDISMLDSQVAMLNYLGNYFLHSGVEPGPQGRGHLSVPTYHAFRTSDEREVLIAANTEPMWQQLCRVLGIEECIEDPRFRRNADRLENRAALTQILEERFASDTMERWLERLQTAGIPSASVNTLAEALAMPQVRYREMVVDLTGGERGTVRTVGNPIKLPESAAMPNRMAPKLGEHTVSVLRDFLGYPAGKIEALEAAGAFGG